MPEAFHSVLGRNHPVCRGSTLELLGRYIRFRPLAGFSERPLAEDLKEMSDYDKTGSLAIRMLEQI